MVAPSYCPRPRAPRGWLEPLGEPESSVVALFQTSDEPVLLAPSGDSHPAADSEFLREGAEV